jgi:protein-disulfide isomerase
VGRKRRDRSLICAACGETTTGDPCDHCGKTPILHGDYRLEKVLGTGAEGTTYRTRALEGGRVMAVKEMPLRRARDDKSRELLRREARILRQLDHPAIPSHLDDFTAGSGKNRAFYLVQDFIDGHTLGAEMQDHRYVVSEVLEILEELLGILIYLHRLSPPVIHRDIKPSNVMRRKDGQLVLIDFGSVRDVLADLEMGGATVTGTFGYMAPEQMMGEASEGSDLYGLGALAVHLLSRVEPHTMLRHDRSMDWDPHVRAPHRVKRLLRKLLEPDPSRRAKNAALVQAEVQTLLRSGLDDEAPPDSSRRGPVAELVALVREAEPEVATTPGKAQQIVVVVAMLVLVAVGGVVAYIAAIEQAPQDVAAGEAISLEAEDRDAPVVPPPPVVPSEVPTPGTRTGLEVGPGSYPPRSGETDPDVAVVVFADFECDYCRKLAAPLAELDEEYGERVAVYFRDFPLGIHPDAYGAHEAARCAQAQGRFWAMHDVLYAHQKDLAEARLHDHAREAGLDLSEFARCLDSGRARPAIEFDREAGREAGVKGVPAYYINGRSHSGARSTDSLRSLIEPALVGETLKGGEAP